MATLPTPSLNAAHRQWCDRPDDERFWNVQDMDVHCSSIKGKSLTADGVKLDSLRVEATPNDDLLLTRGSGRLAFTNWSFGQLCRRIGAPGSYLSTLPAKIAADAINCGLVKAASQPDAAPVSLLHYRNGEQRLRALTSPRYERIWNSDITHRLLRLQADGWRNPPARPRSAADPSRVATEADCMDASFIKPGDRISPGGLYASDRDCFAFMVDPSKVINDGSKDGLYRGFFVQNSEVGDCTFILTFFLFRGTCGNHIIHDSKVVREVRVKHIGAANDRAWAGMTAQLHEYANASPAEEESRILNAQHYRLGDSKEMIMDALFGLKISTREVLGQAWEGACIAEDGEPDTAWGFAQALTRYSQRLPYADKRTDLDRAAGRVLALAIN